MKKVLSVTLALALILSMMTAMPAFAAEEVVTQVSLAGTSQNIDDYVNIILTDKNAAKADATSIKYINQVKPETNGKWKIDFKVKGTLSDYKILFRQNGTTANKIAPEVIQSITPGISLSLSAFIAARTIVADLKVDNGNYQELDFNVIIATYDSMGNLVDTISPEINVTNDVAEITRQITHEMSDNAAYAKVFCWKNFINPLTKAQTFETLTKYMENRGSVGNVFRKLEDGDEVNIVYLGGSVTVGTGIKNPDPDGFDWQLYDSQSWRGLTMQWFKEKYPNSTIKFQNSAIGGTGSFYGAVRTAEDVLAFNPDLVFVMYPINDVYDHMTEAETKRQMEDIIWQIREADPQTDIIMGYDTNRTTGATDEPYDMVRWQEEVAKKYNISVINMGRYLADIVRNTDVEWDDVLSDEVHPNKDGYELYAEVALTLLEDAKLKATGDIVNYSLPDERAFGTPLNAKLIKISETFPGDVTPVRNYNSLYYWKYQIAPGEDFTFEIEGSGVGIKINETGVTGPNMIAYDIDNGAVTGEYDVGRTLQTIKLAENCGDGDHTVTVTNNSSATINVVGAFTWDAE